MVEKIWKFIEKNYPIMNLSPSTIHLYERFGCIGLDELHVTMQGMFVEFVPIDYYNGQCSFTFKLVLRHDLVEGVLLVCDSLDIPDDICVELYNMNIGILSEDGEGSYRRKDQKYDRSTIMRRHTIANIIK